MGSCWTRAAASHSDRRPLRALVWLPMEAGRPGRRPAKAQFGPSTASACRLSLLTMMIVPFLIANLAPTSFRTFSVTGDGNGIVGPVMGSPTLMDSVAEPAIGAGLI